MTRKKVALLLLAIVLVYVGTIAITQIPYQRIYQGIVHPKADAEDVTQQLQSDNAVKRRHGLDAYHYGLQDDSGVLDSLVQTVLHDPDEENRLQALKLLIGKTSVHLTQLKKIPPFDVSGIDQIVSLVIDDSTPPDLLWSLILFAANTAQWQTSPQPVIGGISALLTETWPLAGEEKYAAYAREEKLRTVLLSLKGYARYMMLPDQTLETLLPLYTAPPPQRLRTEVGYIYQYHAINGPLPPTIRQAVVDTMQKGDDKNMRLTAVMTMEWIGKQEGRIPPEMLDTLNNNIDDDWARNNMNHVIVRMQKHFDDPLASLLDVVSNTALPVSIRASALREAGKTYPQDKRFNDAVIYLLNASEAPLRATAISLLPDSAERIDETLVKIDVSLKDVDPGIRMLALRKLAALHVPDSEKISRFEQALTDSNEDVVIWAARTIKNTSLSSEGIQQRLARLKKAGKLQQLEEKPSPGMWQTIIEAAKDTRKHGLRLYWVMAILGIIIAAVFAIYYVFRLLIYIQQRNRRGYAVIGILIVWTGLTYAMVALFFFGAFAFGHNSLVPPKDQFIIDAVVGSALLIYGFIGWFFGRLVNKGERLTSGERRKG
jgi:hypothetical protein